MAAPRHGLDDRLRVRLERARVYLVCDARVGGTGRELEPFLREALAGGVDLVQLRDKQLDDRELLAAAAVFRRVADEHGALFVLNDRPDLVGACGADGVHVGQDDVPVPEARALVGDDRIVGLSTHGVGQIDAVAGVDYFAVGPIHATPTKPGRAAIGLEPVRHAAATATLPWFAIGGIDAATVGDAVAAGASRIVVVRAVTEAPDPGAAVRGLRAALPPVAQEEAA
jgi:thiamine-phosphate pyrophosphorylase